MRRLTLAYNHSKAFHSSHPAATQTIHAATMRAMTLSPSSGASQIPAIGSSSELGSAMIMAAYVKINSPVLA
jgi:hypothetical protein